MRATTDSNSEGETGHASGPPVPNCADMLPGCRMNPDSPSRSPCSRRSIPAALLEVKTVATVKRIDAGSTFFREGDPATSFFVLDAGSVKLTQLAGEGDQVVLLLIGPGDAFGGVAAFGGLAYPVTAEAVTDSTASSGPAL